MKCGDDVVKGDCAMRTRVKGRLRRGEWSDGGDGCRREKVEDAQRIRWERRALRCTRFEGRSAFGAKVTTKGENLRVSNMTRGCLVVTLMGRSDTVVTNHLNSIHLRRWSDKWIIYLGNWFDLEFFGNYTLCNLFCLKYIYVYPFWRFLSNHPI